MAGRRYEEDEALEFWLEGHVESAEMKGAEVTEKLQKTWDKFGTAVDKSLEKHLTDDEYMAVTGSEHEESIKSDVYATLAEHGIGIWDGRWDGYMSQARLKALQPKLKRDLGKWVDVTGGGKLEDAFHEAVYETGYGENPKTSIRRKGYTTKRGVHVKPARFKIEDKGRPGVRSFGAKSATGKYAHRRTMKPLITGGTTLGGPGYTKKSETTRHRILNECVKKFGYRSCLSKVQVLMISTAIKPATRKTLEADKKWLMVKYGGPGSFGPRKGKKVGRKAAKRNPEKFEEKIEHVQDLLGAGMSRRAEVAFQKINVPAFGTDDRLIYDYTKARVGAAVARQPFSINPKKRSSKKRKVKKVSKRSSKKRKVKKVSKRGSKSKQNPVSVRQIMRDAMK